CQLKQYAPRFAEIKRIKIVPINFWRNIQSECGNFFPEMHQHLFIRHAESHVMYRPTGYLSHGLSRSLHQIHDGRLFYGIGNEAEAIDLLLCQPVAEHIGKYMSG